MSRLPPTSAKRDPRRTVLLLAISAAAGLGAGFAMGRLAKAMGVDRASLSPADIAAQMLAAFCLAGGAYILLLAADRRRLARAMEYDTPTLASDEEVGQFRAQAAVVLLAGGLFAAPTLLEPLARAKPEAGWALLVAALVLAVVQSWLNWRLYRSADEFLAKSFVRAGAIAFVVGQTALFGWAAAERFVGAPRLSAWDAFVLITALYFIASAAIGVAAAKR